jgi:ATP-dependent Clp protease ATP-binding subunit ClpC
MFEKFTHTARRTVFFARYEANRFGGREINTEHLVLGILREDKPLFIGILHSPLRVDALQEKIEQALPPITESVSRLSTSVDLPISPGTKRAFTRAAEEAESFKHGHIGPEHLLLGVLHVEDAPAAVILKENGITVEQLRQDAAARAMAPPSSPSLPVEPEETRGNRPKSSIEGFRDLTAAAENGELDPLIGRERELERTIQILSRRSRNNAVLIGETGVGKTAIVEGLARRISDGLVPPSLSESRIFSVDAGSLFSPRPISRPAAERLEEMLREAARNRTIIFCIEGLFDLAGTRSDWAVVVATHMLDPHLLRGAFRCIATGTPAGLRQTIETAGALVRHFEVVNVAEPSHDQAIQVLRGVKEQYEKFHGVVFAEETIEAAVYASGRFLAHRNLPERAIDLLDEAGARARVRRETEPREIAEARKRVRRLMAEVERAIHNMEFEKARERTADERREREELQRRLENLQQQVSRMDTVTPADIEQVVADRAELPVSAVKTVLQQKTAGRLEKTIAELSRRLGAEGNEWVPVLAAWLLRSSKEEVDEIADALRATKTGG